jgi:flagella basal body P-ring formation protein FlgA
MLASLFLGVVTVLVPAESGVRGHHIELGEIVSITASDAATQTALDELELADSPFLGYRRTFTRDDILSRIRRIDPRLDVAFTGRPAVSVFLKTQVVSGKDIVTKVEAELTKLKGARDITWKPNKNIGAVELPLGESGDGGAEIDVELSNPDLVSGRLGVKVQLKVDGVVSRKVWADWDVSVWELLPVLTRNIPATGKVMPDMFALSRTELPPGGIGSVLSPEAMVGAVATHALKAGSVVLETDVTRPRVIHVGDHVTLIVRKGAIKAAVAAVALDEGGIGDSIRIKRIDSKTTVELKGRVISSDTVEIDLAK